MIRVGQPPEPATHRNAPNPGFPKTKTSGLPATHAHWMLLCLRHLITSNSASTARTAAARALLPVVCAHTMANDQEYDLVTIGAGSGGVRASRFAAQYYNAKVAVVELPFGFVSSDDIGGAHLGWSGGLEVSPPCLHSHTGRQLGRCQLAIHAHTTERDVARVGCCMLLLVLGCRCWRHMRDPWLCAKEAAGVWSYV